MRAAVIGLVALAALGLSVASVRAQQLRIGTRVGNAVAAAPVSPGYDDGGRRDPFVTLLAPKKAAPAPAVSARPKAGLAGLVLADVAVKGVVQNGAVTVAVLEGPGGRSFTARRNDRLQDATITSIDAEGVTFLQSVVDALGATRARDVRKFLRRTAAEEER